MDGAKQEETPQTENDHELNGEPVAKKKKDAKLQASRKL